MKKAPTLFATVAILLTLSCTPGPRLAATEAPVAPAPQPSRTLAIAIRVEPNTFSTRLGDGASLGSSRRLMNANLAIFDRGGEAQPYLAAQLPQANTDSWRLSADAKMETTYRLKPNLTWHDGNAVTAPDFVFGWRVYSSPAAGSGSAPPIGLMEDVAAVDPQTVVIRWKSVYAEAGVLTTDFPPLPRHLLESSFGSMAPEAFTALPFWTTQYVGAGPYRLDRWEPGAFIEASAFDGHVLGRPKIDRVRLVFISDPNTALANLLAGEVHIAVDDSIRFQQGAVLTREWGPRNGGAALARVNLWRGTHVQFHPERLVTPGLADVRVRKALAMTVDREGLNQALFEGQGVTSDVPFVPPSVSFHDEIARQVTRYPYDANRAQALLTEAGYTRGPDGVWASPTAGKLSFPLLTSASSQNEAELSILGSGWRQVGFEPSESVMPAAQAQDGQARTVFPGLSTISLGVGEKALAQMGTAGTSAAENRWTGSNRGNWSNPEFDRFAEAFSRTLNPAERVQAIAGMVRVYSDQVPAIPMYFNPIPLAHVAALVGPQLVAPGTDIAWNVHTWSSGKGSDSVNLW